MRRGELFFSPRDFRFSRGYFLLCRVKLFLCFGELLRSGVKHLPALVELLLCRLILRALLYYYGIIRAVCSLRLQKQLLRGGKLLRSRVVLRKPLLVLSVPRFILRLARQKLHFCRAQLFAVFRYKLRIFVYFRLTAVKLLFAFVQFPAGFRKLTVGIVKLCLAVGELLFGVVKLYLVFRKLALSVLQLLFCFLKSLLCVRKLLRAIVKFGFRVRKFLFAVLYFLCRVFKLRFCVVKLTLPIGFSFFKLLFAVFYLLYRVGDNLIIPQVVPLRSDFLQPFGYLVPQRFIPVGVAFHFLKSV